jgi:hypothetical protein
VRELPIPDTAFWFDLERLIIDVEAQPPHYLLPRRTTRVSRYERGRAVEFRASYFPQEHMSEHSLHDWLYKCLEQAIVSPGESSGERMPKARHTAGQRVLYRTGNLKAVQKLLSLLPQDLAPSISRIPRSLRPAFGKQPGRLITQGRP